MGQKMMTLGHVVTAIEQQKRIIADISMKLKCSKVQLDTSYYRYLIDNYYGNTGHCIFFDNESRIIHICGLEVIFSEGMDTRIVTVLCELRH
jgi:hypothetical protein